MNVLSLFDGMSAGQIALKEVGLEVNKYFASEIENHAIKITQHNFPNTIQLGDVRFIKYKDGVLFTQNGEFEVGVIDLLIGGSPCQNLSFIGNKKGMSTKEGLEITSLKQYLDLK